jgi:hypothetical protein
MKRQIIMIGAIIIVAISGLGGTSALSSQAQQEWSHFVQTWNTPSVVGNKKKEVEARVTDDTITICITKADIRRKQ